jgi:hypothetical protein
MRLFGGRGAQEAPQARKVGEAGEASEAEETTKPEISILIKCVKSSSLLEMITG